jgi:tetratricopeptide (TPR) repeat protein
LKTTPKAGKSETWQVVGVCLFLALAVLVVFGQTTRFAFVNYDDNVNVYENPVVSKGLSAHSVGWAFTHTQVLNWIPLTTLSHILDCQIFGLDAGGHHLVNVLLHAANAILLFLVLRQMTGGLWRGAFVAALFAVHPLRAESVAWVSERKDVLSGLFFMLTIGAYVHHARQPSRAGYVGMVLLFALGLMAKSMVATLPFVLLLLDYWPLERGLGNSEAGVGRVAGTPFWGLVREKIPLFALSAGACVATALVPGLVISAHQIPLADRLGNAWVSYLVYLRQMVFPAGLAVPYPIVPNSPPKWEGCLAFLLLAAITSGVVVRRKKHPCLLTGWLWYLGMLAPVIGIIQISKDAAHADRYTYLPQIGLAMAGTWVAGQWSLGWKHRRPVLGGLMIVLIGALALCGRVQTSYWRDSQSLWTRALARTFDNSLAHNSLGAEFFRKGDLEGAVLHYRMALEIRPDYPGARSNLGNVLELMGYVNEAIAQYRDALEIEPDYAGARSNLGLALFKKGEVDEAIAQYRKALKTEPGNAAALSNLGLALFKKGEVDEAIAQYRLALKIAPDFKEALFDLGKALLRKGDFAEAMACLERTLNLSQDPSAKWLGLGNVFLQKGDLDEATACYRQATAVNPRSTDAYSNLGVAFVQKGRIREAIASWEQALEIAPDQVYVQNNLAWTLATTSDASLRNGAKAVALATQANQSSGGANPAILRVLAAAYAEDGGYGLAAVTARRALELAAAQKNDALAATLQKDLKLYDAGAPLRDGTTTGSQTEQQKEAPQRSDPTGPAAPR